MQNKIFQLVVLATALILSVPLIAMQFTNEVDWTIFDFVVMGTLIFGAASLFVVVARMIAPKNRILVGLVFLAAFLLLWVHLAVGIVDSWPLAGS